MLRWFSVPRSCLSTMRPGIRAGGRVARQSGDTDAGRDERLDDVRVRELLDDVQRSLGGREHPVQPGLERIAPWIPDPALANEVLWHQVVAIGEPVRARKRNVERLGHDRDDDDVCITFRQLHVVREHDVEV